jgi:hypothetical protein
MNDRVTDDDLTYAARELIRYSRPPDFDPDPARLVECLRRNPPAVIAGLVRALRDRDEARARCAEHAKFRLHAAMSEASEAHWAAGWAQGLEFYLWSEVVDRDRNDWLGREERELLARLAEEAGGWFISAEGGGEEFVSMERWRGLFDDHKWE